MSRKNGNGVLSSLDWWTIAIYLTLLIFGWFSVCGASYSYGDTDLFSLDTRSGMQIVWILTSVCLGFIILMTDDRIFDTFSFVIYIALLILLFLTIFNPHEIKGSRSWLVMGPLRIQPAEFAKFATALAAAKLMSSHGFNIHNTRHFISAAAIVLTPMLFIIGQKETGSALVYLSFFLMFYRMGMPGSILFTGVAMVVYFVVGIRFEETPFWDTPTSSGTFLVLFMIHLFTIALTHVYCRGKAPTTLMLTITLTATLLALLFSKFIIPFNIAWIQIPLSLYIVCTILYCGLRERQLPHFLITAFTVGSLIFFYSSSYVLNTLLQDHQRERINILLGLKEDPSGFGYNVHQSVIAIGSGGLLGKGFLNGTQTKLKYVPEQDTDFIFCTVGEEEGFLGSACVLLLFLALILRLIHVAERQPFMFGKVYGYCVLSIFLFHVFINVGMVLGLTPVIGIPLPFFSYGGSSLWGFTILLFIFLRIDAGRNIIRS